MERSEIPGGRQRWPGVALLLICALCMTVLAGGQVSGEIEEAGEDPPALAPLPDLKKEPDAKRASLGKLLFLTNA